jgi:iron(III) transport system ATP-binding protein
LELLERVGMAGFAAMRPHQISGGQQQRVGVARALAAEPDLLLCDEALSSLDVDIREHLRLQIRELARETGAAALFVSHDPVDAWRMADRVAVLEEGRLVQTASPTELYREPASARVARFIGAAGGFVAPVEAEDGRVGVRLAGRFFAAAANRVAPGAQGLVYVRPEGVRASLRGAPAELVFAAFEAGRWRAYWRFAGAEGLVCSLESKPPPPKTRLAFAAEHILVFPLDGGAQA